METQIAPSISIVVPAFNNQETIVSTLKLLGASFEALNYEIVVVCDGCDDFTAEEAGLVAKTRDHRVIIESIKHAGKAKAVAHGFSKCHGQVWGFADADLGGQAKAHELRKMYELLVNGDADCVIAERSQLDWTGIRRMKSSLFNVLANIVFGLRMPDTQAGFKLVKREAIQRVLPVCAFSGYEFDVELLAWLKWYGYSIKSFPVNWTLRGTETPLEAITLGLFLGPPMIVGLLHTRLRSLLIQFQFHAGMSKPEYSSKCSESWSARDDE